MADNFPQCDAFVDREEGDFSIDPTPTNHGITQETLSAWLGRPATEDDVRNMSSGTARAIRLARYWRVIRCDLMPPGVDVMAYNFAVNAGPHASEMQIAEAEGIDPGAHLAIKAVQTALGFTGADVDGFAGAVTLATASRTVGSAAILAKLHASMTASYKSFARFPTYGAEWLARLDRCFDLAMSMVQTQSLPVSVADGAANMAKLDAEVPLSNASPVVAGPVNPAPPVAIPAPLPAYGHLITPPQLDAVTVAQDATVSAVRPPAVSAPVSSDPVFVPPVAAVQETPPVAQTTIPVPVAAPVVTPPSGISAWFAARQGQISTVLGIAGLAGAVTLGVLDALLKTGDLSAHAAGIVTTVVASLVAIGVKENPLGAAAGKLVGDVVTAEVSGDFPAAFPGIIADAQAIGRAARG